MTQNKSDIFTSGVISVKAFTPPPSTLIFTGKDGQEILKLVDDGNIYVNGNLVENDKQVVDGLRTFLAKQGF